MTSTQHVDNPFALLMNPESVIQAMEKSERLENLHRRICRPLDRPLLPKKGEAASAADMEEETESTEVELEAETQDQ